MFENEEIIPSPGYLIKSIAEQGYRLETALADLVDNSISANANCINILSKENKKGIRIFISDDGDGMSLLELKENIKFPSNDVDKKRKLSDLGRFGLGMKTASFSQTRRFTVITRKKGTNDFAGRTWDVNYLEKEKKWKIIIDNQERIKEILEEYYQVSSNYLNEFSNFKMNTLIVWDDLYRYKRIKGDFEHFRNDINTTSFSYLNIVFHRFLSNKTNPIKIRVDHVILEPFDPFLSKNKELPRVIEKKEMSFDGDVLVAEGYVLPVTALSDETIWTCENYNLKDLEGVYIYRGDRLIYFGGWNKLINKTEKLKLARLKIDVSNINDLKLELNVSKSKISIPYELKKNIETYILNLKEQAVKEFNNRGLKSYNKKDKSNTEPLIIKKTSTKGVFYEINNMYPVVDCLKSKLEHSDLILFNALIKDINLLVNKQRGVEDNYVSLVSDNIECENENIEELLELYFQNKK